MVATGSYTGDGIDNRAIGGVGFQPDVVIIKGAANGRRTVARSSTMTGDQTKPLASVLPLVTDRIQSLDLDGFTIGTHAAVNTSGGTYHWVALKAAAGQLQVGSYTGNGTSQPITGIGFSPEYVVILGSYADNAIQRSATMTTPYRFDDPAAGANSLNSLDADGFTVGSHAQVNSSGITYHYIAWNVVPGVVAAGSYNGDGLDDRSITGVGFLPEYVIVKADADGASCHRGVHRPSSIATDSTLNFTIGANFANGIQTLEADGFQVGTDCTVNTGGTTYHYLALKDSP